MIIGTFTQDGDDYEGWIEALGLRASTVRLVPVSPKQGTGPDYLIFGPPQASPAESEQRFELGAAWRKTSKKGKAYLSVKLDGPTLAAPIHCALTEQDGSHVLVWSRNEANEEQAAA